MIKEPRNLDPSWKFMPLTADRTPLKGFTKVAQPEYWAGYELSWGQLSELVEGGGAVGLAVGSCNLAVLDCDVRQEWVTEGGTATLRQRHGLDDLLRVASEQGERLPPTYTVKTRSGGSHLVYRQNRDFPVQSKAHREGWLIDVKASQSTFVVAPPTPGYEVVDDLPVAELPEWLARYILRLTSHLPPLGGKRARQMMLEIRDTRSLVASDGGLYSRWLELTLGLVTLSSTHGGWNNHVYLTARQLFDVGVEFDDALGMLLEAAKPWNKTEEYVVRRTVASAWKGYQDKVDPGAHWSYRRQL